jgi:membrane-bound lytic murein transglycosylase D
MSSSPQAGKTPQPPILKVTTDGTAGGERRVFEFRSKFTIGRTEECDVCIASEFVSRIHAEVFYEDGEWRVRDLKSSNGTFVDGSRIQVAPISTNAVLRLGIKGPMLNLNVVEPAPVKRDEIVAEYVNRYFGERDPGAPIGEHTMYVRQAILQVQKKQKRRYNWIVVAIGIVAVAAGGFAWVEHQQASQQRAAAKELFYAMKALDVHIAQVEKLVAASGSEQAKTQVRSYQDQRRAMEANYDRFLTALKVYDPKITPEDRLILRVARVFGECEMDMPPEFKSEVKAYIQKWKSSPRLAKAIRTARDNGYAAPIAREFLNHNLPPEFFYLALQESDFDPLNSGPPTRKGIAKGMWQFIPETAVKYGLKVGPLSDLRRPDTADDRHHWDLETRAAADYIKDLYSTDAQASGLLVMACYNWGEDNVVPLVRSMPANPRERNFWRLLNQYHDKLPKQTYDYVFYIFSAAVIGENPRMFGFDFDSPLAQLENR